MYSPILSDMKISCRKFPRDFKHKQELNLVKFLGCNATEWDQLSSLSLLFTGEIKGTKNTPAEGKRKGWIRLILFGDLN